MKCGEKRANEKREVRSNDEGSRKPRLTNPRQGVSNDERCGAKCAVAWVGLTPIEDLATIKVLKPWTTTSCVLSQVRPRRAAYLPPCTRHRWGQLVRLVHGLRSNLLCRGLEDVFSLSRLSSGVILCFRVVPGAALLVSSVVVVSPVSVEVLRVHLSYPQKGHWRSEGLEVVEDIFQLPSKGPLEDKSCFRSFSGLPSSFGVFGFRVGTDRF